MSARAVVKVKPRVCQIGDDILIDVCREETHTLTNVVTDHPVEQGENISDHVRPEPDKVTLQCFVSNTPLSQTQVLTAIRDGSFKFSTTQGQAIPIGAVDGRGGQTWLKLKKLRDEGTPAKVITTLTTYGATSTEGMVVESLTVPRTSKNYDGLEWSITFKKIHIVKNRATRQVKAKDTRAKPKSKKGAQTTKQENFDSLGFRAANSDTAKNMAKSDNAFIKGTGEILQSIGAGPQ